MEDQNVIIILDKFKKLLEQGNTPKVVGEIDGIILELERNMAKSGGKRFSLLHIPQILPGVELSDYENYVLENKRKINEMANFLNERFPIN